ncbi:MAG: hypothetical protein WC082_09545 [Victivallales bacterium]
MATLKLTKETIQPYLKKIKELDMIVPDWWNELTPEDIAHCYNGVGSELTWKPLRQALSFIFRWALCAVIIHDTIWTYVEQKELTLEDFYDSNENLKINARKQLAANTSRGNPLYWYRYYNAWRAQKACDLFGKEAWNE